MAKNNMKIVWIAGIAINVALTVFNASTGNTGWCAFNAVTAVFCQIGYFRLSNDK